VLKAFRRLSYISMATLLLTTASPGFANCDNTNVVPGTERFFSEAWGTGYDGQRFQSAEHTGINADNAAQLELKWVYGFATDEPRSYPLVTEDTLFIGDGDHGLVALDRETGCLRWENTEVDDITSSIVAGKIGDRTVLVFSERENGVSAVDAGNGEILWTNSLEEVSLAMFSGSPMVYEEKVFVPLSSQEIAYSMNPFYSCCKRSGGMAALDLATGKLLWHRPTIEEPAKVTGEHFFVVDEYGPSGAPVWGAPTLDTKRDLLLFGTGQNYSHPTTLTSDAIFALHTATGKVAWVRQFTANDAYNLACEISADHPNCPDPTGPDFDFGAPPLLATLKDGRDLVFAGQKSGDVYAMSADTGEVVWSQRVGAGGKLGGVHWGIAANPELGLLFVPISDVDTGDDDQEMRPGLYALDLRDGSVRWTLGRDVKCEELECWTGLSSAIAAGPGIVVSGGLDGLLEIVRADDGERLWSFDAAITYSAVNGIATEGGSFDAHGPMLADDLLIVSSGYGSFLQDGGNALLVFTLPDKSEE
jgi:polyvinyl alcohol dehydrogenase (cytochrome)